MIEASGPAPPEAGAPPSGGAARFSLGGNQFGSALDFELSAELLDAYVAAGGAVIDTALIYADWVPGIQPSCSERVIGRWLADRRHPVGVTVATKGGHPRLDAPTMPRLDRLSLHQDAARSRDHLGLDTLPLYYLHRDDPGRPVEDIIGALEELRSDGVLSSYAASNWTGERLRQADLASRRHGWRGFAAHQVAFSLAVPAQQSVAPDLTVLSSPLAALHGQLGVLTVAYSSQAKGYFDKLASGRPLPLGYDTPRNRSTAIVVADLAGRYDVSSTQIVLAALLTSPMPILPVIGCRTVEQLRAAVDAATIEFTTADAHLVQGLVAAALS